jgi:hypothetical protein
VLGALVVGEHPVDLGVAHRVTASCLAPRSRSRALLSDCAGRAQRPRLSAEARR